jgi:hypothetical protein
MSVPARSSPHRGMLASRPQNDGATATVSMVRIPQHVVYRSLASETVVLNVQTGIYYGLNQTAGRMLEVLDRVSDLNVAIAELAAEFNVEKEVIRTDLLRLCDDLQSKGLVEVHEAESGE